MSVDDLSGPKLNLYTLLLQLGGLLRDSGMSPEGVRRIYDRVRREVPCIKLLEEVVSPYLSEANGYTPKKITISDLSIDTQQQMVLLSAKKVDLTPLEYKILLVLARHRNQTMEHYSIIYGAWGDEEYADRNALSVYINRLRRKIEEDPSNPKLIITHRGIGYSLVG